MREITPHPETGTVPRPIGNDLSADAIANFYKRRRTVEPFVRWVKRTPRSGTSENAVRLQIAALEGIHMSENAAAQASFDDFLKIDIRVGRIVSAEPFPEARKPAYKLVIDFGPAIGTKKSSAQITRNHAADDLVGRQVLAVVNFPPRQIGPFMSEVLTLGVPDENGEVMLIGPDRPVPLGGRLY